MKKLPVLVIASSNPAKVIRYRMVLKDFADGVIGLSDLDISEKPEETGHTAEANAQIKAAFYVGLTGKPVFCEDEALYADFLPSDQQPGVHVRRIDGVTESNDEELLAYWEKLLATVEVSKRMGRWHFAYCLATPEGRMVTVAKDHPIRFYYPTSTIRIPGWPLSSLEWSTGIGHPHSESTLEEFTASRERTRMDLVEAFETLITKL